jgi:hypothetical protein
MERLTCRRYYEKMKNKKQNNDHHLDSILPVLMLNKPRKQSQVSLPTKVVKNRRLQSSLRNKKTSGQSVFLDYCKRPVVSVDVI